PDFLPALRALCTDYQIPLIADEVQTGFGRTGKMFAVEHSGVEPCLVVLAKALGGGLPLGAVVGRSELMDATNPGGLGGTFGGNPVACAAAMAVIDVLIEENLPERGKRLGDRALARMRGWREGHPQVGDVRGLGARIAMELVTDRATREPAGALTNEVLRYCHAHGLVLLKAGLYDNVIRLLFPLTISEQELDRGLDILEEALNQLKKLCGNMKRPALSIALALAVTLVMTVTAAASSTYTEWIHGTELPNATPTEGQFVGEASGSFAGAWYIDVRHQVLTNHPVSITGGS